METPKFGFDDAKRAADYIGKKLAERGLDINNIDDGMVLGSGLGNFTEGCMDKDSARIPYGEIFRELGEVEGGGHGKVAGHAQQLVIGPLQGTEDKRLVIAQSGREHPYEGVDTKRSTFWIRVMQVLGVETLFGSNASGILTPRTLHTPALMLISSDLDFGWDNPLVGPHDDRFGPRFPHMGDLYPETTRKILREVAEREGVKLPEGTYIRLKGPNYESRATVYWLRAVLRSVWQEAQQQQGETDFRYGPIGEPVGVVGMSSTFENIVAQQAAQAGIKPQTPAFRKGRAYVSVATNYAAGLGPDGPGAFPSHDEVQENARVVQDQFGRLAKGTILEMRKAA